MDDDLVLPGRHDCRADRHLLDLDTICRTLVVLANLLVEVQVFLALDWCQTGCLDGLDPIQPLDTASTDVSHNHHSQGVSVDLGQGFPVHLPGKHHFVGLDLGPGHTDNIVHRFVVLEVGFGTVEFEVFAALKKTTAVLDDLLQADTDVFSCSDRTFSPRSLRNLITLTSVERDLLDTTGSRTLHGNHFLHARELRLVHQIIHSICLGVLDQTVKLQEELVLVDQWDTAVIPDEVKRVGCDRLGGSESLGRLTVVGELQKMEHFGVFLFQHGVPGVFRHVRKLTTHGMMPLLPVGSGQHGVGVRDRAHLVFRVGREGLGGEDLVGGLLSLRVFLPLDISANN